LFFKRDHATFKHANRVFEFLKARLARLCPGLPACDAE
jgi:hypothetical protein